MRAVSGVTLLSRFGGLAREVLVSRIFGDTPLGAAFAAAFQIPNLFRRLFGEGALSAAFIPAYTKSLNEHDPATGTPTATPPPGQHPADQLASLTLLTLGIVTAGLTILAELVLLLVLMLSNPSADLALLLRLVMVMLPFMPFICTAAILAGMLQVHGRFGPASTGPLVLNAFIVVIAAYFLISGRSAGEAVAYVLGVATVASGATQCLWFAKLLAPHVKWTRSYRDAIPAGKVMFRKFVPVAIGLGTLQLSTFIDTLICTYVIWGGATLFGYAYPLSNVSNNYVTAAQRLYQFPLGVFGIAVATAVFPMLSRFAHDRERFRETLWRGVRLSLFIGVPASVGLILVRYELSYVLYGGGNLSYSAPGIDRVAAVLLGFAPGVWIYSLNHVVTRAFYARGDTRTPMLVSIAMIVVNLSLTLTLMWWLSEAALGWASSISAAVQLAVLSLLARRWGTRDSHSAATTGEPSPELARTVQRDTVRSIAITLVSAAVMFLAVFGVRALIPTQGGLWGRWIGHVVSLGLQVASGGAAFVFAALALRSTELRDLMSRTKQRPPTTPAPPAPSIPTDQP